MLQGDAELPARLVCRGPGVGRQRLGVGARDRDGAVTGKPPGPVVVAGLQGLFDEQAPESRAVDVKVGGDPFAALQGDGVDEAIFRAQVDLGDLSLGADDSLALSVRAQVAGVEARVDVVGVAVGRQGRTGVGRGRGESVPPRRHDRRGIILQRSGIAGLAQPQPVMVERGFRDRLAEGPERMDVGVPQAVPVAELDPQLERGLGAAHEVGLVQAELGVEIADMREGGLAHADGADLF